ncbi:2-hydroxy-3-oxopropionate reductase [Arthrobacter pigmenti]
MAGFDVNAENLRAAEGVTPASSVRALAEQADVILIVVSDAQQSEAVIAGPDGITSAASPPHSVVMMATIGPDAVRGLEQTLRDANSTLIDAPVSGGAQRALDGDLAMMVGGNDEDIAQCRNVLEELGQIFLLGGIGAGQSAKLANQIVFFGAHAALQEAVELADSYNVDRTALLEALSGGTADCWAVRNWGFFDQTARAYDESGVEPSHRPWHKDLAKAAGAARSQGLEAPVTDLIAQVFGDRVDRDARRN